MYTLAEMYICAVEFDLFNQEKRLRDLQMYSNNLLTGFEDNIHFVIPENYTFA